MTEETTTNPVEEEAVHAESEPGVEQAHEPELDENGDPIEAAEDDTDEVEHEGQKYRVPKALKPALMFNADYTRKTQALAEERKALETARAAVTAEDKEILDHRATVVAADRQLALFKDVDWQAILHQDQLNGTNRFAQLQLQYTQLKDARADADGQLRQKEQGRTLEQQRARAKQVEEGQAVLARDIKGWGPELAGKLSQFAEKNFDISQQELAQIVDPRVIKLLHRAFQNTQAQTSKQAVAQAAKVEAVKPTPKVGGGAAPPPKGLDDRLSADEWTRRRQAQVDAKRR